MLVYVWKLESTLKSNQLAFSEKLITVLKTKTKLPQYAHGKLRLDWNNWMFLISSLLTRLPLLSRLLTENIDLNRHLTCKNDNLMIIFNIAVNLLIKP